MKKYLSLSSYSTFLANVSNTTEGIFFVMLFIILLLIPETIFAVQSEIASVKKVNNYTYKGIAITGYWHSAFDTPYLKRQIDYMGYPFRSSCYFMTVPPALPLHLRCLGM